MSSRSRYLELAEKLPYQYVKDSPTVKYYTDWRRFDKALTLPSAEKTWKPPIPLAEEANIVLEAGKYSLRNAPGNIRVEDVEVGSETRIRVESRIQAVHFAKLSTALKVSIPSNTSYDRPLIILSSGGDGFLGHHIILDIGENARAEITIVDYAAGEGEGVKTLVIEGVAGRDSETNISTILLHKNTPSYHYKKILLRRNAYIRTRFLGLAGEMSHYREDYELFGEKSRVEVYGSLVSGNGRIDTITNIVHLAPKSGSNIMVRGVVLGEGLLVHRGVARVSPNARWSSTSIDSLVSILSGKGRGYSIPMLEIQTGRVLEARHSTAVTSVEEDQLFYLQTRGLSRRDGEKLLLEGMISYSGLLDLLGIGLEELLATLY